MVLSEFKETRAPSCFDIRRAILVNSFLFLLPKQTSRNNEVWSLSFRKALAVGHRFSHIFQIFCDFVEGPVGNRTVPRSTSQRRFPKRHGATKSVLDLFFSHLRSADETLIVEGWE